MAAGNLFCTIAGGGFHTLSFVEFRSDQREERGCRSETACIGI